MTSTIVSSFDYATQQIAIYINMINLVAGIPGGILNIIVFLSLKTFRESTCSFYLIIVSFVNVGQLLAGSLSRLVISGYGIDWTIMSRFYCKFRTYSIQVFSLVTLTCICLATIDQYFATCSRPRWQKWSNIKLVRYLSAITVTFWSIFAILFAVYYDIIVSPSSNRTSCAITNSNFEQYANYFQRNILLGFLPNFVTAFFAVLAHRNLKNIAYRTVPLVRRELDKQLTNMLLVQVIVDFFSLLCYNIVSILVPGIISSTDPVILAKIKLAQTLSYSLYYIYTACPFYIYICVSDRFRRQLAYVLLVKYLNHCPRLRLDTNEVAPQP